MQTTKSATIMSVSGLLEMKLTIPAYQRAYKWTAKNVTDLLSDIESASEQRNKLAQQRESDDFKYRIGTILLHQDGDHYDIVDGQQRIISLQLIQKCIAPQDCHFVDIDLSSKATQANIHANYNCIHGWFAMRKDKSTVRNAFDDLLEVVVITVADTAEAFQLFDSQNSRGRELDPHDLLKAYHLREMNGNLFEMQRAVTKWEAVKPADIKNLFGCFLFPILKWSDREKASAFTANSIECFKGIEETSDYTYAERARKSMPSFQITEAFIAGNDFFSMVDHYYAMLQYLRSELETNPVYSAMWQIVSTDKGGTSVGFKYAKTLFEQALLCYYDRFRMMDVPAVTKLFTWAFMLRVDMEVLGFDTVNKYAAGYENSYYSNSCPMFSFICHARKHTAISNMNLQVRRTPDQARVAKWEELYKNLKLLNDQ